MDNHLKVNWAAAQARMKDIAYLKRSEKEFAIGDCIYLKLKSYKQMSVTERSDMKLATKFSVLYQVIEKVG